MHIMLIMNIIDDLLNVNGLLNSQLIFEGVFGTPLECLLPPNTRLEHWTEIVHPLNMNCEVFVCIKDSRRNVASDWKWQIETSRLRSATEFGSPTYPGCSRKGDKWLPLLLVINSNEHQIK